MGEVKNVTQVITINSILLPAKTTLQTPHSKRTQRKELKITHGNAAFNCKNWNEKE
jgi:hypothetical protein